MRILLITDSYPPEVRSSSHLMKEMADELKKRGHKVYVVTSYPQHNLAGQEVPREKIMEEDGVTVIRARAMPHHNVSFIIKGLSQITLPYIFFRSIRNTIHGKIDIAFVHSPPLPLAITAYLVKKYYGAKYILNIQDFFPQNAIDLGVLKNKILIKFFQKMEKRAYENCDHIVTPSEGHKRFLIERRNISEKKISAIYHWVDIKEFEEVHTTGRFRKQYDLKGKFIFLFGGVMGPSQGLDIFIRIATKMREYQDIVFLFVGEGSEKTKLMNFTEAMNLKNVYFKHLVSKKEYPELVKDADVCILSLASANTTPAVPAKLISYMAAGMPVLAFLHKESEGIKIVKGANCGLACVSSNEEEAYQLTQQIYKEKSKLKLYGRNALEYAKQNFTKEKSMDNLEKVLFDGKYEKETDSSGKIISSGEF